MKKVIVFIFLTLFATMGIALAEIEVPTHNAEIGAGTYYFSYKEPSVMKEHGQMAGITGSYTFRDNMMLRAEARVGLGEVDYKNSGTLNNIKDRTFEIRGLGGYGLSLSDSILLTPYVGIGYRYLSDDSNGRITSDGSSGYKRESNYFYSPIGIEALAGTIDGWSVCFIAEYDLFWKGIQKSHLSNVDPSFKDLQNDQNEGYGLRGSIKFIKSFEEANFVIEPFVRYWNIKQSKNSNVTYAGTIIGYGYEPANNTTEAGLKLAVNF